MFQHLWFLYEKKVLLRHLKQRAVKLGEALRNCKKNLQTVGRKFSQFHSASPNYAGSFKDF